MNRIITIILLIFNVLSVYSQNVFININGDNVRNQTVRLSCIDDRISLMERNLKTVNTDENTTSIDINIILDCTKELILKMGVKEYHFLAVPGNTYSLKILPYDEDKYSFSVKEILPVVFSIEKDDNVNYRMEDVDTCLNNFVSDNLRMLYMKDSSTFAALNTLEKQLTRKYIRNEYISAYIKYEFASLKYGLSLSNRKKLQMELFQNSPVLSDNIGYMDCFNTVFSHYFSQGYKFISAEDIEKWLDGVNYSAFNDALGRDSVLKNEIVREVVFLQGMKDAFLDGVFSRSRIFAMLDKFETQTKFSEHKKVAENLKEYLSARDFHGKKISDLKFKNIEGNTVSLNEFLDKPLVICLVQLDCTACLKELQTINYYYDSIKDNCNIAVVCLDNSFEKMYNFVRNSKIGSLYQFPFLYFDNNWEIVEEFKLHFFPTFILMNTDGTIKRNPMESPSAGSLKQFMNKK